MIHQKLQRVNHGAGTAGRVSLFTVVEKLFFALGWILMIATFIAVVAIVGGIAYFSFDALVLHGAPLHHLR